MKRATFQGKGLLYSVCVVWRLPMDIRINSQTAPTTFVIICNAFDLTTKH